MNHPLATMVDCFDYSHEIIYKYGSIAEFSRNHLNGIPTGDLTERLKKGLHSLKHGCFAWIPDGRDRSYECWYWGNKWQNHMAAKAHAHARKLKPRTIQYNAFIRQYNHRNMVLGREDFEQIEGYIPEHLR